jgi:predicted TIM-barrel fold metal-dependent hydrolase
MDDVSLRLKHMDELGVDVQVLHNTMYIEPVAQKPDSEAALARSWNRWLADIWKEGQGRLRWACVVPTMMLDEAVVQMRTAQENGAVAVFLRPVEGNRSLIDPYFYPIFEEASRLNMAIAVHLANGNLANLDLVKSFPSADGFCTFRMPTVAACHMLMMSEIPQVFPKLRWGFIETSAQWIPWVHHEVARRSAAQGKSFPEDPFTEYRIFVSCQSDDDLPYIIKYAGDNCIMIGTDYGHTDTSSELDAILTLQAQTDIDQETKDRILHYNPKALYDL